MSGWFAHPFNVAHAPEAAIAATRAACHCMMGPLFCISEFLHEMPTHFIDSLTTCASPGS
jgi:hypothetical protein